MLVAGSGSSSSSHHFLFRNLASLVSLISWPHRFLETPDEHTWSPHTLSPKHFMGYKFLLVMKLTSFHGTV